MDDKENAKQYTIEETEQRVRRALKGAFGRSPTPFKAVPRKPRASRGTFTSRKPRKKA